MRFLFFGDSICFGQRVSPHLTWVSRTGIDIHQAAFEQDVAIANNSVNGNTTRLALERVGNDLQSETPDFVYVQFGLNDCNCWVSDNGHPRVSLPAFKANLQEIIARARLSGARRILLATNHPTEENGPVEAKQSQRAAGSYRERILQYNAVVREIADQQNTVLVDIEREWLLECGRIGSMRAHLHADGLHLSELGHDFYHRIVSPVCLRCISE